MTYNLNGLNDNQMKSKAQNIFKPEDYGKLISKDLSVLLRTYTTGEDRADVSTETGVGVTTVRNVIYRTNNLTKANSIAIVKLLEIATEDSKKAKEKLNQIFRQPEKAAS